jgi:hypothetical protein
MSSGEIANSSVFSRDIIVWLNFLLFWWRNRSERKKLSQTDIYARSPRVHSGISILASYKMVSKVQNQLLSNLTDTELSAVEFPLPRLSFFHTLKSGLITQRDSCVMDSSQRELHPVNPREVYTGRHFFVVIRFWFWIVWRGPRKYILTKSERFTHENVFDFRSYA